MLQSGKAPSGSELDSFAPESPFRRALEECVRSKSRIGADRLLDLASYRFCEDPSEELARHGASAPARVREEALRAIAKIRDHDVAEYLGKEVLLDRGHTSAGKRVAAAAALGLIKDPTQILALYSATTDPAPEVRAAAIAAAASTGDVRTSLMSRWLADGEGDIRLRALDVAFEILTRKKDAPSREEFLAPVRLRLEDDDWRVRDRAIDLVEEFPARESIPPLIGLLVSEQARLGRHEGRKRVLERAGDALLKITSVEIPARDPVRWQKWWEANQRTFQIGDHAAGRPRTLAESNYFTIAIKSDRLVFVIDVSGSMSQPYGAPPNPGTKAGPGGDKSAEWTKLERVKTELLRVIKNLGEEDHFQIIAFSSHVRCAFPKLVAASKDNKKAAERFVASLKALGGTALWDALEQALGFAGVRGADAGRDADTIFLLTDGEPTAGAIVEPGPILQAVNDLNQALRVQVHTIFVGPEDSAGAQLLTELARENRGEYRRAADK